MTRPTFVSGFIPSPDAIRAEHGPVVANVFGAVWCYCQMDRGVCFAPVEAIAANAGYGTTATRKALGVLVASGWVEAIARQGLPTTYRDSGKWGIGITGAPTRGVGVPQREALGGATRGVGVPQREALPNIQENKQIKTQTKTQTPENPRTPTSSAAKPDNQLATSAALTVGDTEPERRRPGRPRKDRPEGGEPDGAPRWQPVVAAIMAALGRPAPSGSRLPSWLGNTVRTFGAAAGDDPARALALVGEWRQSRQLRQALDGGFVSDHRIPAMVGAWIATTRPAARIGEAVAAGVEDARLIRLGAPSNWREFVYTHDGTRRHPSLVLPSLGLEPYANPASWPAWYRAVMGVSA